LNGDRADDPDRAAQREAEFAFAGLRRVHRHHLAGELARLDGREGVGGHGALGLDPGGLERLARFVRDLAGHFIMTAPEAHCDLDEDLRALVRGQWLAHRLGSRVDGLRRFGSPGFRDPADDLAGVGRADLDPVAGLDPFAAHEQLFFGGRHGHEG